MGKILVDGYVYATTHQNRQELEAVLVNQPNWNQIGSPYLTQDKMVWSKYSDTFSLFDIILARLPPKL